MGCVNSTASPPAAPPAPTSTTVDLTVASQLVKQTWPDVKQVDRFAEKVFAYLLHKYPELKPLYRIPEAYKTEAELLNSPEIKEPSTRFLALYEQIIQSTDKDFNETIRTKAVELYNKNIRTNQIKFYGECLVHVVKYELGMTLTVEEKHAWESFSSEVSRCLAVEISKFPRKSIV